MTKPEMMEYQMNMPGFTAEASLYRPSELYSMRTTDANPTGQVVPQLAGFCHTMCRICTLTGALGPCTICALC
jgi:hypothetical protein